ncbi:uncharacterized protein JN550_000594 [Neoarthrinium moseri]|uniref:uncharacterized protein n=1 Tax=Neoarthrinium moseri TaxID=1658444 RepID=UPI001FDC01C7|nr:uncharacterized protein JN550_000594 [Neoarthrinium moseri]KAI1878412.1 hypothetical protein JN550_000594 [Neoarthrinium moseri]
MLLTALPSELILQIFEQIPDAQTLQSLACTCSNFQQIAEVCLYSRFLFTRRESFKKLVDSLNKDSQRYNHVRDVELRYSTQAYDFLSTEPMDLCEFPNLRSFVSESPFCNAHSYVGRKDEGIWIADMKHYLHAFERASILTPGPEDGTLSKPLNNLKSLTLHWTGGLNARFWTTTPSCPIFLLPSLKKLEISCVKIKASENDQALQPFAYRTNLEELTFTESLVTTEALERILSLPKSLRSLTLHEVYRHRFNVGTGDYRHPLDNLDGMLRAISQQSDNLRVLNIFGPSVNDLQIAHLDLSTFACLTHLGLRNTYRYRLEQPPPSLTTLRIEDFAATAMTTSRLDSLLSEVNIVDCVANCANRQETLKLDLRLQDVAIVMLIGGHGPDASRPLRAFVDNFVQEIGKRVEMRQNRHLSSYGTISPDAPQTSISAPSPRRTSPLRLRLLTAKRIRYMPPYLHTEKRPKWVVRYDSGILAHPYYDETGDLIGSESSEDEEMNEIFMAH